MKRPHLLKSFLILTTVGMTVCFSIPTQAATLIQVYNDAFKNDDSFKSAEYAYLEQKEALPLAYTVFLPQVSGGYGYTTSSGQSSYPNISNSKTFTAGQSSSWSFSASQTIFDWADFTGLTAAKATVASAYASYLSSRKSLIQSTVSTYLAIVQAIQLLNYNIDYQRKLKAIDTVIKKSSNTNSNSTASSTQNTDTNSTSYKNAKDTNQVETEYNQQSLEIINDLKNISTNAQSLHTLTHRYYKHFNTTHTLKQVSSNAPYNSHTLKVWIDTAKKHNLTIISNQASLLSAKATLSAQRGARLPTVGLSASYGGGTNWTPGQSFATSQSIKSVGVSVNLYFGGGL